MDPTTRSSHGRAVIVRPVWSHPGARRFPHRLLEDFGDERCILVSRPEPVVHVVVGALEEAGQQA